MERRIEFSSLTIVNYPPTTESLFFPITTVASSAQLSMYHSGGTLSPELTPTTTTQLSTTPTPQSTPSPSTNEAEQAAPSTSAPTSYSDYTTPTTASPSSTNTLVSFITTEQGDNGGWDGMENGAHIGVVVSIIMGVLLIIAFSLWFCCGGRAWWSRHHDTHRSDAGGLPLYTVRNGRNTQPGVNRAPEGGDAPPMYAEVAPPEHQTVAGGMRAEAERMEEEAVVSDGKTPLSEIPFEDVVLEREVSESESSSSASRGFEQRHHGMGGDTRGHTNT